MLLGAKISERFAVLMKTDEKKTIFVSQAITASGMILASTMFGFIPVISGIFIQEIGRGMIYPLKQAYLNREGRIPSENRATTLSFDSMIVGVGGMAGMLIGSLLANEYSISLTWMISGIILAISVLVFMKLRNGK